MWIHALPYGFSSMDTVAGTVINTNRNGMEVVLDDWGESENPVRAFVFGAGKVGQKVLLTLKRFNSQRGNFIARLDACIADAPEPQWSETQPIQLAKVSKLAA